MDRQAIVRLMMQRQYLITPAPTTLYESVFSLFSPVHTKHWISPGSPPTIEHRFTFNVADYNRGLRRIREIVKGRFQAGRVGYVFKKELPLFSAAYKKDIEELTNVDSMVLNILQNEGPMNIKLIAEISETPSKYIAASLQRLQQAFVVFEDQVDDEWDRAWYLLEDELYLNEYPQYTRMQAHDELIKRMAHAHVFLTLTMVRSFTRIKMLETKQALQRLVADGTFTETSVDDVKGYVLTQDIKEIKSTTKSMPTSIFIMDNNDFLVRAHAETLKKQFGQKPHKNLYYVLYKGEFIGVVLGRFTFKQDELADIQVLDQFAHDEQLKKRIVDKVYETHSRELSPLQAYAGKPL